MEKIMLDSNAGLEKKSKHKQSVYWSPIMLGALVALGLSFLLNLFGIGIGLTLYTGDTQETMRLAIGGFLGLALAGVAAMFTSGFVGGFFSGSCHVKRNRGIVYGFAVWCLSLFLMGLVSSPVGHYLAGQANVEASSSTKGMQIAQTMANQAYSLTDRRATPEEQQVKVTGAISLGVFFIFFLGALAASIGGYCGVAFWESVCGSNKMR